MGTYENCSFFKDGRGGEGDGVNGQLEFHDSLSTAAYSVSIQ